MKLHRTALALATLAAALLPAGPTAVAASPRWSVTRTRTGGIMGMAFGATLDDNGALHVSEATVQAPADKVAAADALVQRLRADGAFLTAPPPDPCAQCSDAYHDATQVRYGGTMYWLSDASGPDAGRVQELEELVTKLGMTIGAAAASKLAEDRFNAADRFTLGRVWLVEEDVRDNDMRALGTIESVWTRRGDTNVFDARWGNGVTGQKGTDVVELVSKHMSTVILEAKGGVRRYNGFYEAAQPRHLKGSVFGGQSFDADILDAPPGPSEAPPVPAPYLSSLRLHPVRAVRPLPVVPPVVARPAPVPSALGTLNDAVAVASGASGACALRVGGAVVCWASTADNPLLGTGSAPTADTPRPILFPVDAGPLRVVDIGVGGGFACALAADRSVWCWGRSAHGALGMGHTDAAAQPSPARVANADGSPLRALSMSIDDDRACVVSERGEVLCWGMSSGSADSDPTPKPPLTRALDSRTAVVRVGYPASCAMDEHAVFCWGRNVYGVLGLSEADVAGRAEVTEHLVSSGAVRPFRRLTVGGGHACVVDARGVLWCWGADSFHQLGDDSYSGPTNPKPVRFAAFAGLAPVQWIAADGKTCAIGGAASALFCTGGPRPPPRDDAASMFYSWASGGSLTGVLRASLLGTYGCAIVTYPGAPAGAGQVACWGFRSGDRVVPGACGVNSAPEPCAIATAVTAPAP